MLIIQWKQKWPLCIQVLYPRVILYYTCQILRTLLFFLCFSTFAWIPKHAGHFHNSTTIMFTIDYHLLLLAKVVGEAKWTLHLWPTFSSICFWLIPCPSSSSSSLSPPCLIPHPLTVDDLTKNRSGDALNCSCKKCCIVSRPAPSADSEHTHLCFCMYVHVWVTGRGADHHSCFSFCDTTLD